MSAVDSGQQPVSMLPRSAKGKNSRTPSPTSLNTSESDTKLSALGKREREVSVEPATPSAEIDASPRDRKDSTRTPARKNRRYLATTVEEDGDAPGARSRSNSISPPLLPVSPAPEMKLRVRQISQGVEDLHWRPQLPTHDQKDEEMQEGEVQQGSTADPVPEADKEDAEIAEISTPEEAPSPPDIQMSKSVPNMEKSLDIGHAAQPDVMVDSDTSGPSPPASRPRSHSDGAEKDKAGVKRKHSERGTSQAPPEPEEQSKDGEGLKRPRDEAEGDANPRETKRPTPPPEGKSGRTSPPSPKVPKLGGFMAYASSSSPFANVKGKNLFASSKSSSAASSVPSTPSARPVLGQGLKLGESSNQAAPAPVRSGFGAFAGSSSPFANVARAKSPSARSGSPSKRSGFEAFGSTSSPFASAARVKPAISRPKSPPRSTNAFATSSFASYATAGSPFAAASPSKPRSSGNALDRKSPDSVLGQKNDKEEEEEDKGASFGERLRAGKDDQAEQEDEAKVSLTEQEVMTGEEDEETVIQVRGKLYALQDGNQWKERGTGIIRLNVKRQDGSSPRLVMRKDAVYTLLLNVTLFPGMRCVLAQDPRYIRFSIIEDGKTVHYNLRVASAKIAQEFLDEIQANIPAN
ncbi:hypothetical protein BKA70DRAFT_469841 [Coprinopsis sp. MPI-PUGE-AT-0042]|nr:hypothetical protein BKA70DRAFT_469841 [Coprinopsis sp. MPI-PUGE-AT-0042]